MTRVVFSCVWILFLWVSVGNCQNWWDAFTNPTTAPTTTPPRDSRNDALTDYYDIDDEGICCECVPFYLCSNEGTIIDTGAVIDPRNGFEAETNVEQCTDVTQLCCRVPSAPADCMADNRIIGGRGNTSAEACECIHWELCLEEFRVSDGSTPTTFIEGKPLPSHSKCNHDLHVCCAFDPEPTTDGSDTSNPGTDVGLPPGPDYDCACVNPWNCDESGFVITDGSGLLDLKNGPSYQFGNCESPLICCKLRDFTTPTQPPVSPPVIIEDQSCYGVRNSEGIRVNKLNISFFIYLNELYATV